MKRISIFILLIIVTIFNMKSQETEPTVLIQTNYGSIKIKLYNETPIHRDNFLKLANDDFYQDRIFHRVIRNFMIQAGEPLKQDSELAKSDKLKDTVQAEIKFPLHYHKHGALAAARLGDEMNPTKASSAFQFYIVTGEILTDKKLSDLEKMRIEKFKQQIFNRLQSENIDTIKALYKEGNREAINELRDKLVALAEEEVSGIASTMLYTDEQREIYKTLGGTPFLDNEYTVFGEVVEGMDVVDKIQNVVTGGRDKPLEPVIISNVTIEE